MEERADVDFVKFLTLKGYHPRSSKHGDALCNFVLRDLVARCASFRQAAERDAIVFERNFTIDPESADRWNADLVVGPPSQAPEPRHERCGPIARGLPTEIWLAVDAKTIMTEHGKARRNRQRDLNSFQDILHGKNARTIVGGLVVVNMADEFRTPLATRTGGLNTHRNIVRLVQEIVAMMGALARSDAKSPGRGLEALGLMIISHTNLSDRETLLITQAPAPLAGKPLSYDAFLTDLCEAFSARFGS